MPHPLHTLLAVFVITVCVIFATVGHASAADSFVDRGDFVTVEVITTDRGSAVAAGEELKAATSWEVPVEGFHAALGVVLVTEVLTSVEMFDGSEAAVVQVASPNVPHIAYAIIVPDHVLPADVQRELAEKYIGQEA